MEEVEGTEVAAPMDELETNVFYLFLRFIQEFSVEDQVGVGAHHALELGVGGLAARENAGTSKIYAQQILQMQASDSTTLHVNLQHVDEHNETLAAAIITHFYRFEGALCKAVQRAASELVPEYAQDREEGTLKDFFVAMFGLPSALRVRELTTEQIGKLVRIAGTVTRTSEVRPELLYGSFACNVCGRRQGVEQQFKYTVPQRCTDPTCGSLGRTNEWSLHVESSKFIDWQKVTLQEHSNEIPSGSMPRSLEIIMRGAAVEKARAGDTCYFTGCLIVIPDVSSMRIAGASVRSMREASRQSGFPRGNGNGVRGLAEMGVKDLTYRLSFLCSSVQRVESRFGALSTTTTTTTNDGEAEEGTPDFSEEEMEEIETLKQDRNVYSRLAQSIAPSVFGHDEVKRGILLMLFGGLHKVTTEGINIRGDINVCIVGDPSMSKSQFLKYVTTLLPRAVYTSGKASSAAGLTATVARDPESGDFNIEAGALMLADNGVCCIDEFDKMDVKDQVAIHEAMEQQTISIAKAGIKATLNARTSILAAANPISGRYDKTKTLRGNLSIGAAVMSRFDLFFVVVDESDEEIDRRIANHILAVHQRQAAAVQPPVSPETLSRYLRYARTVQPIMSDEAARLLVENYRGLRQNDVASISKTAYRITVRQLESMIRLSEALARVHLDTIVRPAYVREAARLLQKSIINVETQGLVFDGSDAAPSHLLDDDDDGDEDIDLDANSRKHLRDGNDDDHDHDDDDDDDDTDSSQSFSSQSSASSQATSSSSQSQSQSQSQSSSSQQTSRGKRTSAKKKKLRMSFEEYERIASILMVSLREAERQQGEGLSQKDLIDAYLRQVPMEDRAQLTHDVRCCRQVIQRLIDKDGLILVSKADSDPQQRILRSHADYDPDDTLVDDDE